MNLKTTFALILLVAIVVGLCLFGPSFPNWLVAPPAPVGSDAGTLAVLQEELTPEKVQRIVVRKGTQTLVTLEKDAGGHWSLPGHWPTNEVAVQELVQRLTSLRSRFVGLALPENKDEQQEYGLDHPAFVVLLTTGSGDKQKEYRLTLSEGAAGQAGAFYRPIYLRLDDRKELVRLGPGLLAVLDHPQDYYQKRRLFEGERVAQPGRDREMSDRSSERVERLKGARSVTVQQLQPNPLLFTVTREDGTWILSQPVRDELAPERRRALLEAVPDLWAEQFVHTDLGGAMAGAALATATDLPGLMTGLSESPRQKQAVALATQVLLSNQPQWIEALTLQACAEMQGPAAPQQMVRVTLEDGSERVLLIGKVATVRTRTEMRAPPPGVPGGRPMPVTVSDEYRYARLQGNPQIFEVKATRFKDLFVPVAQLRDPRLARFEVADVRKVQIKHAMEETLLERDNQERWVLQLPGAREPILAESSKVAELLNKLSNLEVAENDILDRETESQGLKQPLATIQLTVQEEDRDSNVEPKPKRTRQFIFVVGKDDPAKKLVYVKMARWPRVNLIEDSLVPLVERPAVAYRGRRLLDFTAAQVQQITVEQSGKAVVLAHKGENWDLTAPVKSRIDAALANQLAENLGKLEAVEFVTDKPRAEDLGPLYGLAMPTVSATVQFQGKARVLQIGKQRAGKSDFYASFKDEPRVFVVSAEIENQLRRDPLAYLPRQLWEIPPGQIATLTIQKQGADPCTLARQDRTWRITAPFQAPALEAMVNPVVAALNAPTCERYEAFEAKDLEVYGLKTPALKVTVKGQGADARPQVLVVGKAVKEGMGRYARVGESAGPICVLPDALVATLDHTALQFLDPLVLSIQPNQIQQVQSKQGKDVLVLQRKDDGWKVTQAPGVTMPYVADSNAMTALTSTLFNFRVEGYAAYGPTVDLKKYQLDPPAVTLTVDATLSPAPGKPAEKKQIVLELGGTVEGQAGQRYARLVDKDHPGILILSPIQGIVLARNYLDYVDHQLLRSDIRAVRGFTRTIGKDVLELGKRDENWMVLKPAEHLADETTMRTFLEELTQLRAEQIVEYPLKDAKKWGLEQPYAEIKIALAGAESKPVTRTLKIGKEAAPGKDERYVQVDGSQAVALLSARLVKRLLAPPLAFQNRELARFDDASKIEMERGPRKATFTRVDGTWKMTSPLDTPVDQPEIEELFAAMAKLRADELVAEKPTDLKPYGLDKPLAHWRFLDDNKVVLDLLIGNRDASKTRSYAKLANSPLVFLLKTRDTERLLGEMRPRTVWTPAVVPVDVERLTYTYRGNTYVLEKGATGWQVVGKPDIKVNEATVNDTLAALAGLRLVRYAVDKVEKPADLQLYLLNPPELTIQVQERERAHTLKLGGQETSGGWYAAVGEKDPKEVFIISDADKKRIARSLDAFTKPPPPAPTPGGIQGTRLDR